MKYELTNLDYEMYQLQLTNNIAIDKIANNIIYTKIKNKKKNKTTKYNNIDIKIYLKLYSEKMDMDVEFDLIISILEIYYQIYNLPNFDVNLNKFKNFIEILSNYTTNSLYIFLYLNKYVLANSLITNKTIMLSDYIKFLDYILDVGDIKKENINDIKQKLKYRNIVEFKKELKF